MDGPGYHAWSQTHPIGSLQNQGCQSGGHMRDIRRLRFSFFLQDEPRLVIAGPSGQRLRADKLCCA